MDGWTIVLVVAVVVTASLDLILAFALRALAKEIRLYYLAKRAILTRGMTDE
jgi:cytochrome c-type biogenesis protein CcmE